MILKNIVLFLILALLCGCSHKRAEINRYSGFEQTISVNSTKIDPSCFALSSESFSSER